MTEHKGEYDLYEKNKALMEAHQITAEDEYFAARPQIDCNDRRKVFEAGFQRAWNVALSAFEQAALQIEVAYLRKQVAEQQEMTAHQKLALSAIFEACGCIEDGSCQTVQIGQDDATKDWIFTAGKKTIWANSKSELMHKVVEDFIRTRGESKC